MFGGLFDGLFGSQTTTTVTHVAVNGKAIFLLALWIFWCMGYFSDRRKRKPTPLFKGMVAINILISGSLIYRLIA